MNQSDLEAAFLFYLRAAGLPEPVAQYRDKKTFGRGFAWDFAYPEARLLIEVQGGQWANGKTAHTWGKSFQRDCEKLNAAQLAGWRQLNFCRGMIDAGDVAEIVKEALKR